MAASPREAHCRRAGRTRGDERVTETARFAVDGAEYLWIDAAALRCAESVAEAIRAQRYWPPAERLEHDGFAALFHHGTADSVAQDFARAGEGRS